MGKLVLKELVLGAIISLALANPLRIDLDIHSDLPGNVFEPARTDKSLKFPLTPEAAELPTVDLPYERHKASPPIRVSMTKCSYAFASTNRV